MKQKVINITLSLLGVILSLTELLASANLDLLKPYAPLGYAGTAIGIILITFFSVADWIKPPALLLLFFPRKRLSTFQTAYTDAEIELAKHPSLAEVDEKECSKLLNDWQKVGKDLIVMSKMSHRAKALIVDLTTLIALAILRSREDERMTNFLHLGSIAYKRAKHLQRWNDATLIAYYMTQTYYLLEGNLRMNDGHKWVYRMQQIYNKHSNSSNSSHNELGLLLLEVEGLLFKDDTQKRDDAKTKFNAILSRVQTSSPSNKPNVMRMIKNVYAHLGNLAELEMDNKSALAWYEKELNMTSKDSSEQLLIYHKLGEVALRDRDYPQVSKYYSSQLGLLKRLTVEKSAQLWELRAHKGITTALLEERPLNIKEAYLHAQQWLRIAKQHPKEKALLQEKEDIHIIQAIIIKIADRMYEKYIGPLPSAN